MFRVWSSYFTIFFLFMLIFFNWERTIGNINGWFSIYESFLEIQKLKNMHKYVCFYAHIDVLWFNSYCFICANSIKCCQCITDFHFHFTIFVYSNEFIENENCNCISILAFHFQWFHFLFNNLSMQLWIHVSVHACMYYFYRIL